jgi:ADP-heptose:LPS heptosyltransferase
MTTAAVFQIGSLGDTIVSLPSLLSIKELLPDCSDYLLVTGFQGNRKVHPAHIFDMAWQASHKLNYSAQGSALARYGSALEVVARLRYYRPRYAVYLLPADRTPQQVERDKVFFRAAGVRELIGFRVLGANERFREGDIPRASTESYLRFKRIWNERADDKFDKYCQGPLLRPSDTAIASVNAWLAERRRFPARRLVAICPFSNASSKDMLPDTVVALVKRLESELDVEVVLLGGNKDHAAMEQIRLRAGAGLNGSGQFQLEQSAALFGFCALAICVDSGPLHLAGAVGLPTVSAYPGINQPFHRWMPLGNHHTVLYQNVGCMGCQTFICPLEDHPCMRKTTADHLFAAVKAKLTNTLIPHGALNGTQLLEWPQSSLEGLMATA